MNIPKVGVPPNVKPHVQAQASPVQPQPKQSPDEAQQPATPDSTGKVTVKENKPPVQSQPKQSPEEARETPVQKRAEKLKPDTFDILV